VALSDPTDKNALIAAFLSTYKGSETTSPEELVRQYHQVTEYTAKHPSKGSTAVASSLNLPRSRIRVWVDDDGMPDAARGMHIAERRGWFDLDWDSSMACSVTVAIAWIFSGGSIDDHWRPSFAVTDESREFANRVYDKLGVGARTVRDQDNDRATELLPAADGSVLGRLLSALGAPRGTKTPDRELSLPVWLSDAPQDLRLAFAQTFVFNRGVERQDRPQTPIQFRVHRPAGFQDEIRALCESVTTADAVQGESANFRLSAAAAFQLYRVPELP